MANIDKITLNGTDYAIVDSTVPSWAKQSTKPSYTASEISGLAAVATSGSYNDLIDKPTIPAVITVDSTITQNGTNPVQGGAIYSALLNKQNKSIEMNAVYETLLSTLTGTSYENPVTLTGTALEQYNDLANKYTDGNYSFLFLGTPLVTDSETLGNIGAMMFNILYGASSMTDSISSFTINKQGDNYWVESTSRSIQAQLVSGTNIKTINNQSLLGSGNLTASDIGALPASTNIPTVNDGTLTIQRNGTTVNTFTANQSSNTSVDINVPILTSVTVSGTGAVTQALDSNKFYKFGSLTSLTLTLNAASEGLAIYGGKFTAGTNDMPINLPSGIMVPDDAVSIESGKTYEFNILDGICIIVDVTAS